MLQGKWSLRMLRACWGASALLERRPGSPHCSQQAFPRRCRGPPFGPSEGCSGSGWTSMKRPTHHPRPRPTAGAGPKGATILPAGPPLPCARTPGPAVNREWVASKIHRTARRLSWGQACGNHHRVVAKAVAATAPSAQISGKSAGLPGSFADQPWAMPRSEKLTLS